MPAIIEISKDKIIKEALSIVNELGWSALNARLLAKRLNVSTKPLYRVFTSMDEIKDLVYENIYKIYDDYVNNNIDHKNPLLSVCISYVEFSQEYKNLFICLYLSNNLKWEHFSELLDQKWNQATIVSMVSKNGYTFSKAKEEFIEMWLYANGLATLIATNEMKISKNEIRQRIVDAYKRFKKN